MISSYIVLDLVSMISLVVNFHIFIIVLYCMLVDSSSVTYGISMSFILVYLDIGCLFPEFLVHNLLFVSSRYTYYLTSLLVVCVTTFYALLCNYVLCTYLPFLANYFFFILDCVVLFLR